MPEKTLAFVKPQRIAFVQSSWHRDLVEQGRLAFLDAIAAYGIAASQVDLFEVPGAFEIPLHVQQLSRTGRYTGFVAAGLVVDTVLQGYVADTVIKALMDVQLQTELPVFSAVVTPQQFREEADREALRQHFAAKGAEVAQACALTLFSLESLRGRVAQATV